MRVAVIGAGHHGLVAAIALAARCEVLVFEAAAAPGGAVRTEELTLPGFRHDTCAGFFPLTAASPVFSRLDLDLEWVNPPVAMAHLLEPDGRAISLHRDIALTARSLERCAPGAGRAWEALMGDLWPHRRRLIAAALSPLPAVRPTLGLLAGMRGRVLRLAPMLVASAATLGRQLFGDPDAAAWLAGSGTHADLLPQAAGSGAFGLGLNFLAHAVGWPFPRGGAGALSAALVERLCALGGELRCGRAVEAIELARGRVSAVRLADGRRIRVDAVLSTLSPAPLLRLLGPGTLPARLEKRLGAWRYGLGTVKLDWALSGPVPWTSVQAREAAVVHVGGSLSQLTASLVQADLGEFPTWPALVVGQHTLHDPSRAPHGQHTLYAYARVPQRPGLTEEEMAQRVELQIERFAPGFTRLIRGRSIRSPAALEADNPSLCGGDLASGSCELDQQLIFRPAPALCRGRTPIPGLYVAGAWVHPGAGVHGVSGAAAARSLLAAARRRRVR